MTTNAAPKTALIALDPDSTLDTKAYGVRLGVFEIPAEKAASKERFQHLISDENYEYHTLDEIPKLEKICTRLRHQISVWGKEQIQLKMLMKAKEIDLFAVEKLDTFESFLDAWKDSDEPGLALAEKMRKLTHGMWDNETNWQVEMARRFMNTFQWEFTDAEKLCRPENRKGGRAW